MRNFVFMSAFFIFSTDLFALEPRSGEYTCNRLLNYKYDCLLQIRERTVDEWASGACDRIEDAQVTLSCVKVIVGNGYQKNAVVACDRFNSPVDTIDCLGVVANCKYTDQQVNECVRETTAYATLGCFNYYCDKSFE